MWKNLCCSTGRVDTELVNTVSERTLASLKNLTKTCPDFGPRIRVDPQIYKAHLLRPNTVLFMHVL